MYWSSPRGSGIAFCRRAKNSSICGFFNMADVMAVRLVPRKAQTILRAHGRVRERDATRASDFRSLALSAPVARAEGLCDPDRRNGGERVALWHRVPGLRCLADLRLPRRRM